MIIKLKSGEIFQDVIKIEQDGITPPPELEHFVSFVYRDKDKWIHYANTTTEKIEFVLFPKLNTEKLSVKLCYSVLENIRFTFLKYDYHIYTFEESCKDYVKLYLNIEDFISLVKDLDKYFSELDEHVCIYVNKENIICLYVTYNY